MPIESLDGITFDKGGGELLSSSVFLLMVCTHLHVFFFLPALLCSASENSLQLQKWNTTKSVQMKFYWHKNRHRIWILLLQSTTKPAYITLPSRSRVDMFCMAFLNFI